MAKGVTFRVWAPHAESVAVIGSFNAWKAEASPMTREGDVWSADVPNAKPGDEYRFLLRGPGGTELSRIDPCARKVTNSAGNGVVYDPLAFDWGTASFRMVDAAELVVYEMHVGTFNVREPGSIGTFDSAIEKLPYLRDLGVNAVEVMPIAEYAGDFSWGYNPAHPFAVKSIHGGPEGFKRFVKAAHAQGIGVIVDVVYNHFGPDDLGLWTFDGWGEGGKGGIYFYNDARSKTPWGDTRPDYGRAEVRRYLRDNAMMWLDEYRADGLRWDMVLYIRTVDGDDGNPASHIPEGLTLMQEVNAEMRDRFPGRISIGESMRETPWVTQDAAAGGAGFDAQWDALFVHPIREAIINHQDGQRNIAAVARALEHRFDADAFKRVVYTESHDEIANGRARVPEEIWPGNVDNWFARKRSTLGAALVLTAPGIPMLFQGQELLEDRWFQDKVPIDWARAEGERGIHALYRDLIALRRNIGGVTRGLCGQHLKVTRVDDAAKLIVFHRWDREGPRDSVIVVANLANEARDNCVIGFPRAGLWRTRFNSDSNRYHPAFANHFSVDVDAREEAIDGMSCSSPIGIGPYTLLIFSQDA